MSDQQPEGLAIDPNRIIDLALSVQGDIVTQLTKQLAISQASLEKMTQEYREVQEMLVKLTEQIQNDLPRKLQEKDEKADSEKKTQPAKPPTLRDASAQG